MRSWCRLASVGVLTGGALVARAAHAGPLDLDEAPATAPPSPPAVEPAKPRTYSLAETLALADRNHPNLWAARARLAYVHAQLEEIKWVPYWQFTSNTGLAIIPPIYGTSVYSNEGPVARNVTFSTVAPIFHFDLSGAIPLYTFGKITSANEAGRAQVRVTEWDLEKARQQTRMDVRKAYFGLMAARDARYLATEVLKELDRSIEDVKAKLEKQDKATSETDQLRLEVLREEVVARTGEAAKNEAQALAALGFFTGLGQAYDVPDEPLRPPTAELLPVTRYLSAARMFRPEINMARAGVEARKAQLGLARARLFPDIGIAMGADYTRAPDATTQYNPWALDPFNHFYYSVGFGARWSLDILPGAARVAEAESQLDETRALLRLALGGLAVEVEAAYAAVVEAKAREEAWSRAEHKAKHWIATLRDQIELGTQEEKALAEPLRSYINARASHLLAILDWRMAESQLALASGLDSSPGGAP